MKSSKLKNLQGTKREDREKGKVKSFDSDIPQPPQHLRKFQREIYYTICRYLKSHKSMAAVDTYAVAIFAWNWGMYEKQAMHVNKGDNFMQEFESGAKNFSIEFSAMQKFESRCMDCMKLLGLTPYDREKINSLREEKQENTLAELLNRRKGNGQ